MGPSGSAFREDLAVEGIMEKDYQNKKQRDLQKGVKCGIVYNFKIKQIRLIF